MKPIETFENSKSRANRLVRLYESLVNDRRRRVRSDWSDAFKNIMHWASDVRFDRVDNPRKDVVIILKESAPAKLEDFKSEALKDLLRAAHTAAVAALDRYIHDIVLAHFVSALGVADKNQTREMKKIGIPILDVKHIIERAKKRKGKGGAKRPRPMFLVKRSVQEKLHSESFLSSHRVEDGLQIIGISAIWSEVARKMTPRPTVDQVKERLNSIAQRRHQIVHEGDILRRLHGGGIVLRGIDISEVKRDITWLASFVESVDRVVREQLT